MTVVHTYFYIVIDTQRGCHNLKKIHMGVDELQWAGHVVRMFQLQNVKSNFGTKCRGESPLES